MEEEKGNTVKLGLFVLAGTIVLLLGLYVLGSKRDLFSRTIAITAHFGQVSGLRVGNNVRYAGIDVGTVESITILSDTDVVVGMKVKIDAAEHIRTNAVVSIASDGLMGNQLVKIEPGVGKADLLSDGAVLRSTVAVDTDAMLRTLDASGNNLVAITTDLRELVRRINSETGLVALFTDTTLVKNIRVTVEQVRGAAAHANELTGRTNAVIRDLEAGKGALGVLVGDPAAEQQVRTVLENLQHVSDSLALVSVELARFSSGLNSEGGLVHTLTRDTAVVSDMKRMIANLDTSAATLSEDLRALQHNWFFRKYFKQKAR